LAKKGPIPSDMNPDRDRCGLLWFSVIAPTTGQHARQMAELANAILLRYGFEPA